MTRITRMQGNADLYTYLNQRLSAFGNPYHQRPIEKRMELLHKDLTDQILKAFYNVYNELGFNFLEKVYQNALYLELKIRGFQVEAQKKITVYYKNVMVGEYYADLLVNNLIILELKATETVVKEFEYQLINYLRATNVEVGLLLNFGTKPDFRRKVFGNDRKNING